MDGGTKLESPRSEQDMLKVVNVDAERRGNVGEEDQDKFKRPCESEENAGCVLVLAKCSLYENTGRKVCVADLG